MGTGNGKGEAKKRESGGEVLIPGKEGSRGTAPPARCKSLLGKDCAQGRLNLSSERPGQEQRQGWGRGQGRGTGPYVWHRASPVLRDPSKPGAWGEFVPLDEISHPYQPEGMGTPPVSPEGSGHPTCVTSWQCLCQHLCAPALPLSVPHIIPGCSPSPLPMPAPSGAQGGAEAQVWVCSPGSSHNLLPASVSLFRRRVRLVYPSLAQGRMIPRLQGSERDPEGFLEGLGPRGGL